MIKIFYKIWVDAIIYEQTHFEGQRNWKIYTLIPITGAQGFNLFTFFFWSFHLFGINFDFSPNIDLFPGKMLDNGLSAIITYGLPLLSINYFLIFYKKRYERLVKKYEYKNGKLYKTYLIFSFGIFIISLWIGIFCGWL